MFEDLKIINWPDPRLLKVSKKVEVFDGSLKALAGRMFELMREHGGVGLAAPQVGVNIRLFVMNATGAQGQDRVYVNPVLTEPGGEEEGEEGCLSLPKIRAQVLRSLTLKMSAQDVEGRPFEQVETGYIARIWQHETDHLNGKLILDYMGAVAKMGCRKQLRELEQQYKQGKS